MEDILGLWGIAAPPSYTYTSLAGLDGWTNTVSFEGAMFEQEKSTKNRLQDLFTNP